MCFYSALFDLLIPDGLNAFSLHSLVWDSYVTISLTVAVLWNIILMIKKSLFELGEQIMARPLFGTYTCIMCSIGTSILTVGRLLQYKVNLQKD